MERSEKVDLYKNGLLRRDVIYITFLAAGETDLSLLPEPVTLTEKLMYKLCEEKAQSVLDAAKVKPVDSEHPEGNEPEGKSMPKPEEPEIETIKESSRSRIGSSRSRRRLIIREAHYGRIDKVFGTSGQL